MEQQHSAISSAIGPKSPEPLISTEQAAQILGVSDQFLEQDRITRRHGVPFFRVGRAIRYRASDLETWLLQRRDSVVVA